MEVFDRHGQENIISIVIPFGILRSKIGIIDNDTPVSTAFEVQGLFKILAEPKDVEANIGLDAIIDEKNLNGKISGGLKFKGIINMGYNTFLVILSIIKNKFFKNFIL